MPLTALSAVDSVFVPLRHVHEAVFPYKIDVQLMPLSLCSYKIGGDGARSRSCHGVSSRMQRSGEDYCHCDAGRQIAYGHNGLAVLVVHLCRVYYNVR